MPGVTVSIPGAPQGKGRPRFTRRSGVYTPKKTQIYEAAIAVKARQAMQGRPPVACPVTMYITALMPIPKSWPKKGRCNHFGAPHCGKPDADNIIKIVMDACNNIVYDDDKRVSKVRLKKIYSDKPALDILCLWTEDA